MIRKRKHEKKPAMSEQPKPTVKVTKTRFLGPGDPVYDKPWTMLIGGLKGQSPDNPPPPKTEPPKPKTKPKTFAERGIMSGPEILSEYESLEGKVKMLAVITKENVAASKVSTDMAGIVDRFDAVRGQVLEKLASLRAELASCREFIQQCDRMPPSESALYGTRVNEAQKRGTSLQREINELSQAEGWHVNILRQRAKRGLAIVLERASGGQT